MSIFFKKNKPQNKQEKVKARIERDQRMHEAERQFSRSTNAKRQGTPVIEGAEGAMVVEGESWQQQASSLRSSVRGNRKRMRARGKALGICR